MIIKVRDERGYKPETSHDGGDYRFTTVYTQKGDNQWEVLHFTTADFNYCALCGSFYQGEFCPCGMTEPDLITTEQLNNALREIAGEPDVYVRIE
jgi:hypothetical protein